MKPRKGTRQRCQNKEARVWSKRKHQLVYEILSIGNHSLYYFIEQKRFLRK